MSRADVPPRHPELKVLVSGLNAPKGLRAQDGTLYVSDIDELVAIDLASHEITAKTPVPGATFLNDVAIASDGRVFVSDMIQSQIFVVKDGKARLFAAGKELESPNGLLIEGNRLIVAAWGFITDPATFGVETPGHLYALDLDTAEKTLISRAPVGNLDGLEATADGYLVTDWVQGKVLKVTRDGTASVLFEGFQNAANLGFDGAAIYVPEMGANRVSSLLVPGL